MTNTARETIRAMMEREHRRSIAEQIMAYEHTHGPLRAPRPLDREQERMGQLIEQVMVQSLYKYIGR